MALELFDLKRLLAGADPEETVRFEKLGQAVRQASSMSSVRNDIDRAREMMDALKRTEASARAADEAGEAGEAIDRGTGATIQALFMQAVALYVRATHTGGKGRNKLHIVDRLDGAGRDLHVRFVKLRDRYLAHFDDPGPWEEDRVVLAIDPAVPQMALSYPHCRHYVRAEDSAGFDALLAAAQIVASDAYTAASVRLNLVVNRLFDEDPGFLTRLRGHPFDPATFFDPDEVEGYLTGIGSLDPDPVTKPRIAGSTRR